MGTLEQALFHVGDPVVTLNIPQDGPLGVPRTVKDAGFTMTDMMDGLTERTGALLKMVDELTPEKLESGARWLDCVQLIYENRFPLDCKQCFSQ